MNGAKERIPRVQKFKRDCGCFIMARGAAMWERGEIPERATDEDADTDNDKFRLWAGYMMARSLDFMARAEIARKLNNGYCEDVKIRD